MPEKKWDVKRGYGVYKSIYTQQLQRWIKEVRIKKGEVFVWSSGMSGWRRPEELEEFSRFFERKKIRKKKIGKKIKIAAPKKKKEKSIKVVIIDDEKDMCWLLENGLKKKKFDVSSAVTGKNGLEIIKKYKPDIVLLDIRLKDTNGLNLIKRIKIMHSNIKIIIISAFGGLDIKKKALRLGADDFVDKPFKTQEVIKRINKIILFTP